MRILVSPVFINVLGVLLTLHQRHDVAHMLAGTLEHVVNEHTAPVFTLRWNKRGDLVITGSADKGTKVLDANTWRVKQIFTPHTSEHHTQLVDPHML